jgi:hypothetical protein
MLVEYAEGSSSEGPPAASVRVRLAYKSPVAPRPIYGSIFTPNSVSLEPEATQSCSFRERGIPSRQSSSLQSAIFMGD